MMANNRLSVEVQLFVDGKQVTNFFAEQVQLIEPNSPQEIKLLKRYDDFTGKITLTRKQCWRLIWSMVQGRFKVGT